MGYHCLILMIGNPLLCQINSNIRYVFDTLLEMPHVVLLTIDGVSRNHSVMISQTCRLFGASLVQRVDDGWDETYLVTSDSDIWPLNEGTLRGYLDLTEGAEILHGNIGTITVAGNKVPHIPLSYIGMKTKTWRDVMTRSGMIEMPKSPEEIIDYFFDVFGNESLVTVTHGGVGWYMDQCMISLRINQWMSRQANAIEKIQSQYGLFRKERIDARRVWNTSTIQDKLDAHLPYFGFEADVWSMIHPLVRLMYPDTTIVQWCDNYANKFQNKSDCKQND